MRVQSRLDRAPMWPILMRGVKLLLKPRFMHRIRYMSMPRGMAGRLVLSAGLSQVKQLFSNRQMHWTWSMRMRSRLYGHRLFISNPSSTSQQLQLEWNRHQQQMRLLQRIQRGEMWPSKLQHEKQLQLEWLMCGAEHLRMLQKLHRRRLLSSFLYKLELLLRTRKMFR